MSLQEEEEILEICSSIRKQTIETEPQTSQETKKMLLINRRYENFMKFKLRYIEENKGDLPALHFAARISDVDVCQRLVEQGADVNEKCSARGATPLHYAAMNKTNGLSLIKYFIEKGLDIEVEDAHREKAIHYALRATNYYLIVQMHIHLKERIFGKPVNSGNLPFAILNICLDSVRFVYNNKRHELWSERPGFRILKLVCEYGDLDMCKWPLECFKIDVNQFEDKDWKDRILQTVAGNRTRETSKVIRYLSSRLDFTADQQSKAFRSAFYYKIVNREGDNIFCAEDAEELFKGFDDTKIKIGGQNLLQFCVNRNHLDAAKIVHGKDGELINEIDEQGATILHRAARFGNVEMCQWLIDQGQDITALNTKTRANFLHYAAQNSVDGENIIKTFGENLREYVNQTNVHNLLPLHFTLMSKQRDYESVAEALLKVGAKLSFKIKGYNLLHFCIASKNLDCSKFVHNKNKNLIKERGRRGKTTLQIAADFYDKEIYEWLVEKGCVQVRRR